ncbi:MAG: DUF1835 domain-containing protein [Pedobacter sp.]|nr:DUF1835 domain-containing protein [Pedobacter sp.]MDQ8053182.1 DUF1835 domain-containing protein [Pedobacter sp.]
MMRKILHILNGDATAYVFSAAQIVGDTLIWREILSEGPVSHTHLWEQRKDWMQKNFEVAPSSYLADVIGVAEKLKALEDYDEIILWFEYDLVCQINLIYILATIGESLTKSVPLYLICPESIAGMPNFKGLGELSADQLQKLWPTRLRLTDADLHLAKAAWKIYIANDQHEIAAFLEQDFGQLYLLKEALKAHLQRFSDPSTHLNAIEQLLLTTYQSGIRSKRAIYEAFWAVAPIYGMGDRQIDLVLKNLQEKGFSLQFED